MADSIISPAVGTTFAIISGVVLINSAARIERDRKKVPMIAIMAAFVFAGQMINFTIPGTGSSGHLGGGILLAWALGPPAAFLAISSVLVIQSLFFADGGLLALGTNIFNLGIMPAYLIYPFFRRWTEGRRVYSAGGKRALFTAAFTAVFLGALMVVIQASLSGMLELGFGHFAAVMLPIHMLIGIGEGLITVAVARFILANDPMLFSDRGGSYRSGRGLSVFILTLFTAGFLSWFASSHPDGLEWSLEKGKIELQKDGSALATVTEELQDKTALMPNYAFRKEKEGALAEKFGSSLSGLGGSLLVMSFVFILAVGIRSLRKAVSRRAES